MTLRAPSYNPVPLRSDQTQIRPRGRWLGLGEVAERMAISKRTLYRRQRLPDFPKPVNVNGHPKYNEAEIDAWMRTR